MMRITVISLVMALAACGGMPAADKAVVDADADRIEARIVRACIADKLFRPVVRAGVTIAVPAATLPMALVQAGVDRICANPALYAHEVGIVERLTHYLATSALRR